MCPLTPGICVLPQRNKPQAFTRVELLAVIAAVTLLLAIVWPALGSDALRNQRAVCANNLSRIGQAFADWAADHGELYPWHVSLNAGGTLGGINRDRTYYHFSALSNEVKTPSLFACPSDASKSRLNSFPLHADTYVSYFLAHPSLSEGRAILSGDRNMGSPSGPTDSCLEFGSVRWFARPSTDASWNLRSHIRGGHLLFNDGSVESTDDAQLRSALSVPGVSNRFHYLTPRDF